MGDNKKYLKNRFLLFIHTNTNNLKFYRYNDPNHTLYLVKET